MFGFDGSEEGFATILRKISTNDELQKLTHKEVRAYARCLLALLPNLIICPNQREEIKTLLASMSSSGIPHYDRSFLASRILKLLEIEANIKSIEVINKSASEDNF